jgi:hypothetical protein
MGAKSTQIGKPDISNRYLTSGIGSDLLRIPQFLSILNFVD